MQIDIAQIDLIGCPRPVIVEEPGARTERRLGVRRS